MMIETHHLQILSPTLVAVSAAHMNTMVESIYIFEHTLRVLGSIRESWYGYGYDLSSYSSMCVMWESLFWKPTTFSLLFIYIYICPSQARKSSHIACQESSYPQCAASFTQDWANNFPIPKPLPRSHTYIRFISQTRISFSLLVLTFTLNCIEL